MLNFFSEFSLNISLGISKIIFIEILCHVGNFISNVGRGKGD